MFNSLLKAVLQVALSFINDQAMSTHGKLTVDSIFISPSGEWKLGGFELLSNSRDESPLLYVSYLIIEHNYEAYYDTSDPRRLISWIN